MHDDDRQLLERIKAGDGESFGVLFDRTRAWLLSFVIVPRVGAADADDVLSETFHTALAKIGQFQWRGVGLLHWLATIARRKALERVRRRRRREALHDDVAALLDLRDDAPTAEAALIHDERMELVRTRVAATLERLTPRYAQALRVRLLESRGREECAEMLGVTPATFDVVLHRATRAFAREWGRS